MSFFEDASLVLIPSAQKTSKVYSVKPTDGTGDLAFTRSNDTATRVASSGLIEKVRTNLLTYSNTFSNAAWDKSNLTATGGQSDPNGGTTAFLLTSTNTSGVYMGQTKVGIGCLSIYAKAGTRSTFSLIPTGYNNGAFFDLSSVTATASGIGSLAKIESVGSGWFRCSVAVSSSTDFLVSLSTINGSGSVIGDTMTFAFAQGETGDIATPYIATTTAAVSVGPVANVPRLDYLGSTCPKLILEPQRVNLALQSESVTTSTTNVGYTATSNATTSPDGYASADQILEDTSTLHLVQKEFSVGSTTDTYAGSFFVKANGRTNGRIIYGLNAAPYSSVDATFNLTAGTITAAVGDSGATAGTSKIENYGNGWYRVSVTGVIGTAGTHYVRLQDTNGGVAGDPTKGFFVWGFQAELGAYATSYIPTLGASVTRGADICNKASIASLIGQTEGTIFVEFNRSQDKGGTKDFFIATLSSAGSSSNVIYLLLRASTEASFPKSLELGMLNGGALQFDYKGTTVNAGTHKLALAYKANDLAVYFDGVQIATDSSCTVPAMDKFTLGIRQDDNVATTFDDTFGQALLFPTRLSNADLAALTA